IDDVGKDEDFKGGSRVSVVEFVNANGEGIINGCLGDIKNYLKNGKLKQFVVIIKSCNPNALGNLTMTLKDLSGIIPGTIHHKFIDEGGYGKNITVGVTLILVSGSGSGAGGSVILMEEEEIVKLMEEEMDDLELRVCRNVIEQEDLYKFDKEALNLALEEEARQARAEHDWLEKCRQEEESGHGFLFRVSEGGGALGSLGALKASTHSVIAIFMYPLRAVEAACALEVDAMGALDLVEALKVEVEAMGALDLVEALKVEVEAMEALDLVEVKAVAALDLVEALGALDLIEVVGALDLVEVEWELLMLWVSP
ncbi:homeobox-leucine zipper protein HDG11, partial [Tanacetum coccineum]